MVASDRISAFDVVLAEPIPDKGKVLTQMSIFWFETTGDDRPQPPDRRGRARRGRRPGAPGPAARHVPGRVRRPRLHLRLRLEGVPASRHRSAGSSCPSGLQESDQLPEPIFTPATKAEIGEHDENIDFDRACRDRRLAAADGGAAARLDRALRARPHPRLRARDHPRRHQVRVRLDPGRRDRPRRRGADARLLPLLARRRLRAGPRPGLLRQAVRPRLARRAGLGPLPAGPAPPRRGDRGHDAPSTARPTSGSPAATLD